jgi:integrase
LAVRKSGGRYTIEFESRGHRVFRRLPAGATKAQAEEYELKLRRELIDQIHLGKKPIVALDFAVKSWFEEVVTDRKDENATKSKVKLVLPCCAGKPLSLPGIEAAAQEVLDLPRIRGEGPLTIATKNRRISVLKATAKWAWKKRRWTAENLSAYLELDADGEIARDRVIDKSEIRKLIGKGRDQESRAFMAFGAYALMRSGEIMKLGPDDVKNGAVRAQSKNGPVRMIKIVPQLKPYVKAIPFTRHVRTLYGEFEAARDAAGLEDLVHHDLRRSGATILLNRGVPLEVVAYILGDSLETTRKVYARVLNRTVRRAMDKGFKPIKNPIRKGGPGGI